MLRRSTLLIFAGLLSLPTVLNAQPDRFELGQRLRAFERAWEQQTDAEARKRAVEPLIKATTAFFSLRAGEAGRGLDQARFALASEGEPTHAAQWAAAVTIAPSHRLLDVKERRMRVRVEMLYDVAPVAEKGEVRLRLVASGRDKPLAQALAPLDRLAGSVVLELAEPPPGDHRLLADILVDGKVLASTEQTVSLAADVKGRVEALKKSFHDNIFHSTEAQTFAELRRIVTTLAEGKTLETNYPAARLLAEVEEVNQAARTGAVYYALPKTGQFWLRVASPQAKGTEAVRLFIPDKIDKSRPVPLVIALHGAGGSENMFFDGYGDGKIVALCRERGWALAAPRVSGFLVGLKTEELVAELAKRWPIDPKRVLIVGHSLGAMQATQLALKSPDKIAAVAALGGGQRIDAAPLKSMPFFVAAGSRDFALRNAKVLHDCLVTAEATHAVFREYPDIEHLVIVQHALPDVFAFFDESLKR